MDFHDIKLPDRGITLHDISNPLLKQRKGKKVPVINVSRKVYLSRVPPDVLLKNHTIRSLEDVGIHISSFSTIFMVYPTVCTYY